MIMRSIIYIFITFLTTYVYSQDSTFIEIKQYETSSLIFYKTNSYAISIEKNEVLENKKYFKRELIKKLKIDSVLLDTVWINDFIKDKWQKEVATISWVKLKTGIVNVINLENNEMLEFIYYRKWNDSNYWHYQFFDYLNDRLLMERRNYWIGTPSF